MPPSIAAPKKPLGAKAAAKKKAAAAAAAAKSPKTVLFRQKQKAPFPPDFMHVTQIGKLVENGTIAVHPTAPFPAIPATPPGALGPTLAPELLVPNNQILVTEIDYVLEYWAHNMPAHPYTIEYWTGVIRPVFEWMKEKANTSSSTYTEFVATPGNCYFYGEALKAGHFSAAKWTYITTAVAHNVVVSTSLFDGSSMSFANVQRVVGNNTALQSEFYAQQLSHEINTKCPGQGGVQFKNLFDLWETLTFDDENGYAVAICTALALHITPDKLRATVLPDNLSQCMQASEGAFQRYFVKYPGTAASPAHALREPSNYEEVHAAVKDYYDRTTTEMQSEITAAAGDPIKEAAARARPRGNAAMTKWLRCWLCGVLITDFTKVHCEHTEPLCKIFMLCPACPGVHERVSGAVEAEYRFAHGCCNLNKGSTLLHAAIGHPPNIYVPDTAKINALWAKTFGGGSHVCGPDVTAQWTAEGLVAVGGVLPPINPLCRQQVQRMCDILNTEVGEWVPTPSAVDLKKAHANFAKYLLLSFCIRGVACTEMVGGGGFSISNVLNEIGVQEEFFKFMEMYCEQTIPEDLKYYQGDVTTEPAKNIIDLWKNDYVLPFYESLKQKSYKTQDIKKSTDENPFFTIISCIKKMDDNNISKNMIHSFNFLKKNKTLQITEDSLSEYIKSDPKDSRIDALNETTRPISNCMINFLIENQFIYIDVYEGCIGFFLEGSYTPFTKSRGKFIEYASIKIPQFSETSELLKADGIISIYSVSKFDIEGLIPCKTDANTIFEIFFSSPVFMFPPDRDGLTSVLATVNFVTDKTTALNIEASTEKQVDELCRLEAEDIKDMKTEKSYTCYFLKDTDGDDEPMEVIQSDEYIYASSSNVSDSYLNNFLPRLRDNIVKNGINTRVYIQGPTEKYRRYRVFRYILYYMQLFNSELYNQSLITELLVSNVADLKSSLVETEAVGKSAVQEITIHVTIDGVDTPITVTEGITPEDLKKILQTEHNIPNPTIYGKTITEKTIIKGTTAKILLNESGALLSNRIPPSLIMPPPSFIMPPPPPTRLPNGLPSSADQLRFEAIGTKGITAGGKRRSKNKKQYKHRSVKKHPRTRKRRVKRQQTYRVNI